MISRQNWLLERVLALFALSSEDKDTVQERGPYLPHLKWAHLIPRGTGQGKQSLSLIDTCNESRKLTAKIQRAEGKMCYGFIS